MNEVENYLFDTHGYLLIEGALSTDELTAANAAIDAHAEQINIRRQRSGQPLKHTGRRAWTRFPFRRDQPDHDGQGRRRLLVP